MKTVFTLIFISLLMSNLSNAQDAALPYHQIPEYPKEYNEYTVAARFVDGLGFRYYWATEGLTNDEMDYRPAEDVRTIRETLDHIYGLSKTIVNSVQSKLNVREQEDLTLEELRKKTLENIHTASNLLKEGKSNEMDGYKILFSRGDNTTEFPFWNMMNGPVEDAVYHTGQVVAFRRAAGNPIPPGVRFLMGERVER